MGGEKMLSNWPVSSLKGSPPRGRGKVMVAASMLLRSGITPAWAGKRKRLPVNRNRTKDHPRVGGEKCRSVDSIVIEHGSPPRGRGKVQQRRSTGKQTGITPAWAGKSISRNWDGKMCKDHPRVGGEKASIVPNPAIIKGSPPRGRGKEHKAEIWRQGYRITPAWAGKRLKRSHRSGIFISGPIPFHSVLHRPAGSGGSRAGRDGSPAGQPQNAGPA